MRTIHPASRAAAATSFDWRASLALAAAALFWSGNFVAGRALRDAVDPLTLNTLRWSLALLLFLPFVAPRCLRHAPAIGRHWRLLLALGATGIAAFHCTVYVAVSRTTATNALLVLAMAPVAIVVGSMLLGRMRPTGMQWLGSAVSLVGVATLVTRGDLDAVLAFEVNRGDLWMLLAVVLWAAYSLLLRHRPADLPQDVTLAASIGFGLLLLVPPALLLAPQATLVLSTESLWALGYIVVFPSVLAFLLWSWGLTRVGPERAGQFVHLMPVFGPLLAMALLGESLVPAQEVGAGLVFAGIALVNRFGR